MSTTQYPGYPLSKKHSQTLLAPYRRSPSTDHTSVMELPIQTPPPVSTLPNPIQTNKPHSQPTTQTSYDSLASHRTLARTVSIQPKQSHQPSEGEETDSFPPANDRTIIFEHYVPLGTTSVAPRFRLGRYRFPDPLRKRLVPQIFHDAALEIHRPTPFQPSEFTQRWNVSPIHFDEHQITHIIREPLHHGIIFLLDIAEYAWPVGHPVQRGMRVEIRGYHEDEVRYMITWRLPCLERDAIYVQVNAYLENGCTTEFYDIDWPALRLRIPITSGTYVDAPFPPAIIEQIRRQQEQLDNQELVNQTFQNGIGTTQPSFFRSMFDSCASCISS